MNTKKIIDVAHCAVEGLTLTGTAAELKAKQAKIAWLPNLNNIYTYSGKKTGKSLCFWVGPACYELVMN